MEKRRRFTVVNESPYQRSLILACMLFWSILSYMFVSRLVLQTAAVVGDSMAPTFLDGHRYVVLRWVPTLRPPRRGEIIGIRRPGDEAYAVKRVIGLPGETIAISGGGVHINGEALIEPYLRRDVPTYPGPLGGDSMQIPEDRYFVLGDNRTDSFDSRFYGTVRRQWIVGVVK